MKQNQSLLSLFLRCINASYVHTNKGGDYAIQREDSDLYLLFEWSDGCEDWHNNMTFSAKKVNPNDPKDQQWRVHRGFLKVWQAMRPEVLDEITASAHAQDIQNVFCIGYSHGAALALLATEELSRTLKPRMGVVGYGFGCPRVVFGKLPDTVRQHLADFHTIRNVPDLVTHLPPAAWGYRHINLREIGQKGKYGPIEAHTSQAYVVELSKIRSSAPSIPSALHTHPARE